MNKFIGIAVAAAVLLMMLVGCAGSDMPARSDLDKVLKDTPLAALSVYRVETSQKTKAGVVAMAAWGTAKDNGEDINIFIVAVFNKKQEGGWVGYIPSFGLIAEPVKEKDKASFEKERAAEWEKYKVTLDKQAESPQSPH